MIKASELRIGNLIMYNPPQGVLQGEVIVTEITNSWVGYENSGGLISSFIDMPRLPLEWCEPIVITDEWLDRIGLKAGAAIWESNVGTIKLKMYKNSMRDGSGRYDGVTFSQMIGNVTEHHIYNICCRNLHELQNFYYLFTGQELTIIQ